MITRLYDEQFYSFAHQLKARLNTDFGDILERYEQLFTDNPGYVKDFSVAISKSDRTKTNSILHHFRIHLDTMKTLEIIGIYDEAANRITNVEVIANLPFIKEWNYDTLRYLRLKKEEKDQFMRAQLKFIGNMRKAGIDLPLTDIVRTSVNRKLPIVQMLIQKPGKNTFLFLQQPSAMKVLSYVYRYSVVMTSRMEKIAETQ